MTFDSLEGLLEPGQSAVAVFTRQDKLCLNADGTGSSGNWKLDAAATFDKVVIYCREDPESQSGEVIVADYVETPPSAEPDRSVLHFRGAQRLGVTDRNWQEFASTGTNPVRLVGGAD